MMPMGRYVEVVGQGGLQFEKRGVWGNSLLHFICLLFLLSGEWKHDLECEMGRDFKDGQSFGAESHFGLWKAQFLFLEMFARWRGACLYYWFRDAPPPT